MTIIILVVSPFTFHQILFWFSITYGLERFKAAYLDFHPCICGQVLRLVVFEGYNENKLG